LLYVSLVCLVDGASAERQSESERDVARANAGERKLEVMQGGYDVFWMDVER
jgi:hypothetical protein